MDDQLGQNPSYCRPKAHAGFWREVGTDEAVGSPGNRLMSNADFADLVRRSKDGDEDAIRTLLSQFEPEVRMAIRRLLPRILRTKFDSMDFVQTVWASIFVGDAIDPTQFQSSEHLLAYLKGVAENKVRAEYRRRTCSRKYDVRREEPLYVRRSGRDEPREVPSSLPSASADFRGRERLEALLRGRTTKEREIVRLRGEGQTFEEIARRTGLNEKTARRLIEELRRRELGAEDP
jgi:RNA polymerase sigma-70 factor, ECF subfamily